MSNLTEARHQRTRADIIDAAIALFGARGYDATTMADVADAAGVSRRTAYRHFPNKEDLLYEHPRRWLDLFNDVVAGRATIEPTRDVCRRGILAVAELIQSERESVVAAWAIIAATETLKGRTARTQETWIERYVELIQADLGADTMLIATTLAGTLVAMTNALVLTWTLQQPDADMPALTLEALDYIDPLWPEPTRNA